MEITESNLRELNKEPVTVNMLSRQKWNQPEHGYMEAKEFYRGRSKKKFENKRRYGSTSPRTRSPSARTKANWICYNCRKPGHIARECRENRNKAISTESEMDTEAMSYLVEDFQLFDGDLKGGRFIQLKGN